MAQELTKDNVLSEEHWISDLYKQRMVTSHWKFLLLNDYDQITYKGRITRLKGKNLGCGVVEVSKEGCP